MAGGSTGIDIERARRSVHVYFENEDFHLDIVACIAPDGFDEPIWVPDRGYDTWIESHPLGVVKLIKELNDEHGDKFRPLVRLFKHFRNYQMDTCKPKSYWLVAMVIEAVRKNKIDMDEPIAVVFAGLVDHLYWKYKSTFDRTDDATPNIKDPMLEHNVSPKWDRSHFETFVRRLDDGRQWAARALEEDDQGKAIELWQKVFGAENFPTTVDEYAKQQASLRQPGDSVVTGAGIILPGRSVALQATQVPPTKFYGETDQ